VTVSGVAAARHTTIESGGLDVVGTLTSTITVNDGGTVSGSGTILGDLVSSGRVVVGGVAADPGLLSTLHQERVIPEPSSNVLLVLGLIVFGLSARTKE
jgi:hypothetical protein